MNRRVRIQVLAVGVAALLVVGEAVTPAEAQTISNWTRGGGNWTYCNGHNWSTDPLVPLNDDTNKFEVVINPTTAATITYDCIDAGVVSDLTLSGNVTFNVGPGRSYTVDGPASISGVISVSGGAFLAPQINAPVSIGQAKLWASAGGQLSARATSYSSTSVGNFGSCGTWTSTLFSASGTNSLLDLKSLTGINAGFYDNPDPCVVNIHRIAASNSGVIDLSGLQNVVGPQRGEDRLEFSVSSDGVIRLPVLQSVSSGFVRFDIDNLSFGLPALTSAVNTTFDMAAGSTLDLDALTNLTSATFNLADGCIVNLPELHTQWGGTITVPTGGAFNAANLQSLDNVTIALNNGGSFNAPSLIAFRNSSVGLNQLREFITGNLEDLNNSRIGVAGGTVWGTSSGDVSAPGYVSTSVGNFGSCGTWTSTLFSASGTNSLLDLRSLTGINAGFYDNPDPCVVNIHRIAASNSGVIDLSGVGAITAPQRAEDRLDIVAEGGAAIDLGSLQTVGGGGPLSISVSSGSHLFLGDFTLPRNVSLTATDLTSAVSVNGSLFMSSGNVSVGGGAVLGLTGSLSFSYTDPTKLSARTGILELVGTDRQYMEVGGNDGGAVTPANNNFGWGQMIIGQRGQRATVELVDLYNNSTASANTEALYLFGLGGPPGLKIVDGSTLIIHNINVYAWEEGTWVDLHSLFPPGVGVIRFDQGWVALTDLAEMGDCDFDGDVDRTDFESFQDCFYGPDERPDPPGCTCHDIDGDRDVDLADFAILQRSFTGD